MIALSTAVQIGIHQVPVMERIFRITALGPAGVAICLGVGLIPVSAIELAKLARRRRPAAARARAQD